MTLKRHLAMKYLGALNTAYLVFMKYQQRKRENTPIKTKRTLHKLNYLVKVKQGPSDEVFYRCSLKYACI